MRDYGDIMDLAIERGQYSGYLDAADKQKAAELERAYAGALRAFADATIRETGSADAVIAAVEDDFGGMRAASDPATHPLYDGVAADLIGAIRAEGMRRPLLRRLFRHRKLLIAGVLLAVYLGVRWQASVPITYPLEARAGMIQRAEATDKVLRYDEWAGGSGSARVVWFKEALFWPIEPREPEIAGASELLGVIVAATQYAREERLACGLPVLDDKLEPPVRTLIGQVTTYLRDDRTRWSEPVGVTIIDALRRAYPCSTARP